jgi:hypothetical protein
MNKTTILLILSAATVLFGLNACNQDNERAFYDETAPVAYSFRQPVIVAELTPDHNGILQVRIVRTKAAEAASVQVKLTASAAGDDVTSLFTLASPVVSFEAGAYETAASVQFTLDDLIVSAKQYQFSIEFDDAATAVSPGGHKKTDVKASRKLMLTYESAGTGTYESELFQELFQGTLDVSFERAVEAPNIYRAKDLYADGYDILIEIFPSEGRAVIPLQEIGYPLFQRDGYSQTWISANDCAYANGVITIKPGSESVPNVWYADTATEMGAFIITTEIFRLPAGSY